MEMKNHYKGDEESLQINEVQEFEEDEQETTTQENEEIEIEIAVNDYNVLIEQNEENTMTIGTDEKRIHETDGIRNLYGSRKQCCKREHNKKRD